MKLEEAIPIIAEAVFLRSVTFNDKFHMALTLAYEAAKHILNLRETGVIDPDFLLPSETRE